MKTTMRLTSIAAAVMLAGCAARQMETIQQYHPIADLDGASEAEYEAARQDCLELGVKAEDELKTRRKEEDMDLAWTEFWLGPQPRIYSREKIHFAPRRIVDRCLAKRGFKSLNIHGYE